MEASAQVSSDGQKKPASPFKKLLKRMNPKKKRRAKKKSKEEERRKRDGAPRKENTKPVPEKRAPARLEAEKENIPVAPVTKPAPWATVDPVELPAPLSEEPATTNEVIATTTTTMTKSTEILEQSKDEAEVCGKTSLFKLAGIICAAVESIPLITSTVTCTLLGSHR